MALDGTTVRRRIRAAMVLADLDYDQLAQRIDQRGLGARTLRKFTDENDEREARRTELQAIAEACDLPAEWFTVPDLRAALSGSDSADDRLAELEATVRQRIPRQDALGETVAALAEELAQIRQELRARQTGD